MSVVDRFTLNLGDFEIVSEPLEKHGTGDQTAHGNWARGGVSSSLTESILDRVRNNGGLSVNMVDGSEPKKGYMVASPVKKAPVVDADDFFDPSKGRKILADFVKANKKTLGSGKKYLGLWHNKEDNKVYLDVSENVQDKARAVQLGRERNQISIWDVVNFDEIQTGGTGVTEKGRSESSGSTIEYVRDDGRANRHLGKFGLRQVSEVEKHSTHDQSSHAGDRGRGNNNPNSEQEVTDPNAPKPELKPGRKPDASGSLEERADKLANGERIQVTKSETKKIMKIMARREDDPDLTNMHIENTLLYDEDNLNIPRNKMPQVPSDTKAVFIAEMEKRGTRIQRGVADPAKLHPIQKEMSASKVGKIMKRLREKGMKTGDDGRIVISKDNYVIDGHHRWAAAAMLSFEDSSVKIPVIRVDMNHKDLISATLAWNKASGIQPIGLGEENPNSTFKKWAEFDEIVAKAVRGRTVIRFQPGLKPTLKHLSGQHDQSTHGSWAGYNSANATKYFGSKRAKDLKKVEGQGPSVSELNTVFDASSFREADGAFNKIKSKVEQLYKTNIKGTDGLLYKTEIEDVSVTAIITEDNERRYGIFVKGDINSFTGEYAGQFQRTIKKSYPSGGVVVEHDVLQLEPEFEGHGVGTSFYIDSENKYIVNGYEKIIVQTGLSLGGYVWAKSNFSWDDGSRLSEIGRKQNVKDIADRWRDGDAMSSESYDMLQSDPISKKRYEAIGKRLDTEKYDSNNLPTPYELADFTLTNGTKVGKEVMMRSKWWGVKYLTPSGTKDNV